MSLSLPLDSASDTDENGNPTPGSELGSHFVRNVPMFAVPQVFGSNAVTRGLTGAASGAGMTAGMTALEGGEQDPQAIAANALTQGVLGAMHGNAPVTDDVLRATMNNTNASKAARMAAFNELGRRALVAEQARAAEELRQKAIEDAINQAMQSTEQSQTQTDGAAATDKPSTATDKPSTATDKPSTATDKPSTATDKPSSAAAGDGGDGGSGGGAEGTQGHVSGDVGDVFDTLLHKPADQAADKPADQASDQTTQNQDKPAPKQRMVLRDGKWVPKDGEQAAAEEQHPAQTATADSADVGSEAGTPPALLASEGSVQREPIPENVRGQIAANLQRLAGTQTRYMGNKREFFDNNAQFVADHVAPLTQHATTLFDMYAGGGTYGITHALSGAMPNGSCSERGGNLKVA